MAIAQKYAMKTALLFIISQLAIHRMKSESCKRETGVFMTDKKTEKLLKRPDAFQASIFRAFAWFNAQRQRLILVIVPVVLVILAAAGFQYYQRWNGAQRKNKLSEIEKAFASEDKALSKKKAQLREAIRKMEDPAQDKKDATAVKDAPKDASTLALIEAKKKELADLNADHKDSLAQFTAFFQANESNSEGWRAGMSAVGTLVKDKKFEAASPILKTILERSIGIDFYQVQVRFMYIAILEELKKFDDALAQVTIVQPLASEDLQARILLTKARLEIQAGKKEEANKTLDTLITTQAASPEARQALAIKAL